MTVIRLRCVAAWVMLRSANDRAARGTREQILRQLAERPTAPSGGSSPKPAAGCSSGPASEGLRNRMDELHQPVVDRVNRDFMPLASECIDQAQARPRSSPA
jgi:hypothetical protein